MAASVGRDWAGRRGRWARLFRGGARGAERSFRRVFGDATLKDTVAPLLVPCYDLATAAPFMFSRADAVESDSYDFALRDVCAATCAAGSTAAAVRSVDGRTAIAAASGGVAAMGNRPPRPSRTCSTTSRSSPRHHRRRHPRPLHRHRRLHLRHRDADAHALPVAARDGARHRRGRGGHGRRVRRHGVRPHEREQQQLRAHPGQQGGDRAPRRRRRGRDAVAAERGVRAVPRAEDVGEDERREGGRRGGGGGEGARAAAAQPAAERGDQAGGHAAGIVGDHGVVGDGEDGGVDVGVAGVVRLPPIAGVP